MADKVAIIGSNVSGLFAAWACNNEGIKNIEIYSDTLYKPFVGGFQYLHDPCDLDLLSAQLQEKIIQKEFSLKHCSEMYSQKVYGRPDIKNSIDKISFTENTIWNLSQAVYILWDKFGSLVKERKINTIDDFKKIKADLIFSTIPISFFAPEACSSRSAFVTSFHIDSEENQVFYDVNPDKPAYRFGVIFKQFFIESTKPSEDSKEVKKVETLDKELIPKFPRNVIRVGRYAEWDKKVLVSDVYYKVRKKLSGR